MKFTSDKQRQAVMAQYVSQTSDPIGLSRYNEKVLSNEGNIENKKHIIAKILHNSYKTRDEIEDELRTKRFNEDKAKKKIQDQKEAIKEQMDRINNEQKILTQLQKNEVRASDIKNFAKVVNQGAMPKGFAEQQEKTIKDYIQKQIDTNVKAVQDIDKELGTVESKVMEKSLHATELRKEIEHEQNPQAKVEKQFELADISNDLNGLAKLQNELESTVKKLQQEGRELKVTTAKSAFGTAVSGEFDRKTLPLETIKAQEKRDRESKRYAKDTRGKGETPIFTVFQKKRYDPYTGEYTSTIPKKFVGYDRHGQPRFADKESETIEPKIDIPEQKPTPMSEDLDEGIEYRVSGYFAQGAS